MKKLQYYIEQLKAEVSYLPKNFGYLFSPKKRAIYIGCTGNGNLGDEVVYKAIKNLIGNKIYLYPISYAKPSSGKYLRRFFKMPDLIILGGGTLIRKKKSESYLKLFFEYHTKYPSAGLVVYGSGVGDTQLAAQIGFPTDVKNWKLILNKCRFIGVRGSLSKKVLEKDWEVSPEINILHDPAIYFKRDILKAKEKQKRIGINFCSMIGRIYGLDQSALELFAQKLVKELISEGWNIYLYPTVNSDMPYMQKILGPKLMSKVEVYNNFENIDKSLSFLESMDVFVGQRLHSIIFAAIVYTPFHAIEYESKTSDFLNSMGLDNVSTRTDELDVNRVINKVNMLYENLEKKQNELFELVQIANKEQITVSQKFINNL
ncbi:polysaccharide pyruvyl transferase family protein [Bizionia paragorgiae]|uniref:polysaccharide pyruvyl transferase family protein n=1 Tax=Bizionia paragorgiae TaxID=283786 RepID=UPI003A94606A